MTTSKHTPGPWLYGSHAIQAQSGEMVARTDTAMRVQDARLIAAAPEMAEAMLTFVARVDAGEVRSKRTYAAFKAILAKAGVA
jgi:3,4-dihydroxy-2-butanone 4-phosphate synthase